MHLNILQKLSYFIFGFGLLTFVAQGMGLHKILPVKKCHQYNSLYPNAPLPYIPQSLQQSIELEGTWYYVALKGLPGQGPLNECGKKSNITYTGNTYHTQFYDNYCKLLTDNGGTFTLKGKLISIYVASKDEHSDTKITTTQTILQHTEHQLIIRDDLTGVEVTLRKAE